jgi:L-methionine (R)-S-oxide reductase
MGFQNAETVFESKSERYQYLKRAMSALLDGESNWLANCANAIALIQSQFHFHWIGFYWVEGDELILGCFQGPVACTRIAKGKGVCGTAWESGRVQNVPNVHAFPGHIACSALSQSEVVLPLHSPAGEVIGVLDVDSSELSAFDEEDVFHLSGLMEILMKKWSA